MTTFLDLVGVACLSLFAWFVWAPAALLIIGMAALLISRKATK